MDEVTDPYLPVDYEGDLSYEVLTCLGEQRPILRRLRLRVMHVLSDVKLDPFLEAELRRCLTFLCTETVTRYAEDLIHDAGAIPGPDAETDAETEFEAEAGKPVEQTEAPSAHGEEVDRG